MTQPTRTLTQSCKSMDYGEQSPVQLGSGFRRERRVSYRIPRRRVHGSSNGSITSSSEPTKAAGAVADGNTVERGLRVHMDPDSYLRENNSYRFFERLNDLVITGPTGTNVNDIFIGIVGPGNQKNDTARRSRGK